LSVGRGASEFAAAACAVPAASAEYVAPTRAQPCKFRVAVRFRKEHSAHTYRSTVLGGRDLRLRKAVCFQAIRVV
jgi:hypothetical protein